MQQAIISLVAGAALLASTSGAALASQPSAQECARLFQQTKQKNQQAANQAYAKYVALGCPSPTQP